MLRCSARRALLALCALAPITACAAGVGPSGADREVDDATPDDPSAGERPAPAPPPSDEPPAEPPLADRPADPPGDATYDFVIDSLAIGLESPVGVAAGFDLDRHATRGAADPVGCGHSDFSAPTPLGGHDGVDNQLGRVLEAARPFAPDVDPNAELGRAVREGRATVIVRVLHVGDPVDDGAVEVELLSADRQPDGAYLADPAALRGGVPRVRFPDALIRDGRLEAGPARLMLSFDLSDGRSLTLPVSAARIAFDLQPGRLDAGVIGGHLALADVVAAVSGLVSEEDLSLSPAGLETLLGVFADIETEGGGTGRCDAISLGLVFGGVAATVVDP